jgi:shikimate kinase
MSRMKALVLVGFMGAGKTTVGEMLANDLSLSFLDTDRLIEEKTGTTIPEIFAKHGEDYFREIEAEVLAGVVEAGDAVVSSGGGIVTREENRNILKNDALVV